MKRLTVVAISLVLVIGTGTRCMAPEPQIIIQTRVIEKPLNDRVVVKEVTRLVPGATPTRAESTITPSRPLPTRTPTASPPTLRHYLPPGREQDEQMYIRFGQMLKQRTGYGFEVTVPASYPEAIQALCDGRADIAWLATPAYLIANDLCGAEARFAVARSGAWHHVGQIMVQVDKVRMARGRAPIRSLTDLNDRVIGFTDPLSTTGYLFPKAMLIDSEVRPSEEIFFGGDAQAVLAVYSGEVDAAAAYWRPIRSDGSIGDARATLLGEHPDVTQVVKILRLTDPIPNDPVVFRKGLPVSVKDSLVASFIDLAKSDEGSELLYLLYGIAGLVPADDSDYDVVRKMGATLQLDFADILGGQFPHTLAR